MSIGKSLYSSDAIQSDISGPGGEPDGKVDFHDFTILSSGWMLRDIYHQGDISGFGGRLDYQIDALDVREMAGTWLDSYN
jgi:hypothetical protein